MSLGANKQALMGAAGAAGGGGAVYDYQIKHSARFNGTSSRLRKTWGSTATNNNQVTVSVWVKQSVNSFSYGDRSRIWSSAQNDLSGMYFMPSPDLNCFGFDTANGGANPKSNAKFRDPSAWQHIVWIYDSTQSTSTDRVKVYFNGEYRNLTDTSFWNSSGLTMPGQNTNNGFGKSGNDNHIGDYQYNNTGYFEGQMADFISIDGTSVISDFGETVNGVWIPKDPSGLTFGNNGFHLDFADSSALGNDVSGNNNDWAVDNIATHDQLLDSPTFSATDGNGGNFCTWNPLQSDANLGGATKRATLSEGNLLATYDPEGYGQAIGTMGTKTGKFYTEYYVNDAGYPSWLVGWTYSSRFEPYDGNSPAAGVGFLCTMGYFTGTDIYLSEFGNLVTNPTHPTYSSWTPSGTAPAQGDIIMSAMDFDAGKAWFGKNGEWGNIGSGAGNPATGANASLTWNAATFSSFHKYPFQLNYQGGIALNAGQDPTSFGNITAGGNADDNGFGNFKYDVPAEFLSLCSGNLSAAGADPAEQKQPSKYFDALTYTGNGSNTNSLTTTLKAISYWGKNRTLGASVSSSWFNQTGNDFGTGTDDYTQFNTSSYGYTSATYQGVSNPQSTTINVGSQDYINGNGQPFVAYLLGNNEASVVTDTSGDIDSVRWTDADAGISVMSYTGSGTNGNTLPHGLGVKPSFVILKNSTNGNGEAWRVWSDAFGDYNDYAVFNTDAAWSTSGGIFTADPTTTMLPLASGGTQNNSGQTYVAWVFANTEGMVSAGTYVGNGSAEGTFVYTGFAPAWVMAKPIVTGNWRVQDTARSSFNVAAKVLMPNSNAPEDTYASTGIDILSNGFKMRTTGTEFNQQTTFVYLCFSENPFKYATAR